MWRFGLLVAVCALLRVAVYADVHVVVISGHNMVQLNAFSHQFGAVTCYDGAMNTYCVSRHGRIMYLTPYSTTAWIGDSPVQLEAAPVIVDGVIFVPMGMLCHTFALDCTWGPAYSQVVIIDGFSHQRVTWARDAGWAARPHHWLHPATYRTPQRFHAPPRLHFHAGPAPRGNHLAPTGRRAPSRGFGPHAQAHRPTWGRGMSPASAHLGAGPGGHNRPSSRPSSRPSPRQGARGEHGDNRR